LPSLKEKKKEKKTKNEKIYIQVFMPNRDSSKLKLI
jgi:hypothetical protein